MTIKLAWADHNTGSANEDGYRVYRSTSPFSSSSLPPPLASLGPDVTTYDDLGAIPGTLYYYMVEAYKGSLSAFTPLVDTSSGVVPAGMWDNVVPAGSIKTLFSLRKRLTYYAGAAVRIRDTNDNSEQDVGFDPITHALAPFTTVGQARVVTWYDQSGNGLDMTNPNAAEQPLLNPTGAPNGAPCVDFSGGSFILRGPSFSDAAPNPALIARPSWVGAFTGVDAGGFRYAWHIPHKELIHTFPYYRIGMLWTPSEDIETRWNGTVLNWAASPPLIGNAILMADFKADITKMLTYVNGTTINSTLTANGDMTAPFTTAMTVGANPAVGEAFNGTIMELLAADASLPAVARTTLYDDIQTQSYI